MFKRILSDAFSLVFSSLDVVFRACGAWFLLLLVFQICIMVFVPELTSAGASSTSGPSTSALFMTLVSGIFSLVSSASIGVAWHRYGLLGEVPDLIHLKVGGLELSFIGKSLLIMLVTVAVFLPVGLVAFGLSALIGSGIVAVIIYGAAFIFLVPHLMRLNLMLPATAVERPIGLKEAHALGVGLGWPMIGAGIVLSLPFILASVGLQMILTFVAAGLPLVLIQFKFMLLGLLIQIIVTVLGISVITAGYRLALERQNQGTA
ncbi:hypothetical protein [Roseibium litorale]|uniref:ABC-2 type transport system permease protein n=1 Tax=Roseibium litorale TaxID=2803841 RepID=A0ABR9CMG6_9HYPH|nr:hypothetical protein [Roseibium litorale]MBD8892056.1 hypothetical protein [Roseibium litorale]